MNDTFERNYDCEGKKEGMSFEWESITVEMHDDTYREIILNVQGKLLPDEDGDYPRIKFHCEGRRIFYDDQNTVELEWDFPGDECLDVDFTSRDWEACPWDNEEYLYVSDL